MVLEEITGCLKMVFWKLASCRLGLARVLEVSLLIGNIKRGFFFGCLESLDREKYV